MEQLSMFSLPLPAGAPPPGYGWESRDVTASSTTTAFEMGINARDTFLGQKRCVVCGSSANEWLQHCHIVPISEEKTVRIKSASMELLSERETVEETQKTTMGPKTGKEIC